MLQPLNLIHFQDIKNLFFCSVVIIDFFVGCFNLVVRIFYIKMWVLIRVLLLFCAVRTLHLISR